jgi:hypothetical protein
VFFYVTDSGNWGVIDPLETHYRYQLRGWNWRKYTFGCQVNLGVSHSVQIAPDRQHPHQMRQLMLSSQTQGTGGGDSSGQASHFLFLVEVQGNRCCNSKNKLGLGTAATPGVGVGSGQIPDMRSFPFQQYKGYEKLPSGQIRQWGTISIPAANASTDFALDTLPSHSLTVFLIVVRMDATTTNTPCFATAEAISTTQIRLKAIAIDLTSKTITQGMSVTVAWEAIGHKNVRIYLQRKKQCFLSSGYEGRLC